MYSLEARAKNKEALQLRACHYCFKKKRAKFWFAPAVPEAWLACVHVCLSTRFSYQILIDTVRMFKCIHTNIVNSFTWRQSRIWSKIFVNVRIILGIDWRNFEGFVDGNFKGKFFIHFIFRPNQEQLRKISGSKEMYKKMYTGNFHPYKTPQQYFS